MHSRYTGRFHSGKLLPGRYKDVHLYCLAVISDAIQKEHPFLDRFFQTFAARMMNMYKTYLSEMVKSRRYRD